MRSSYGQNDAPMNSLLLQALQNHQVSAQVTACDHYRIHGGLAVESDYIVTVCPSVKQQKQPNQPEPASAPPFESFEMSKTYSAFRAFAQQLYKATEAHDLVRRQYEHDGSSRGSTSSKQQQQLPVECFRLAQCCQLISHLIDSQKRTRYLGKVNYMYVQVLARERTRILNDVLEATVHYFPSRATGIDQHPYIRQVALIIQTFFLTDHCLNDSGSTTSRSSAVGVERPFDAPGAGNKAKYDGPFGLFNKVKDEIKLPNVKLDELNPLKFLRGENRSTTTLAPPSKPAAAAVVVPLSCRQRRSVLQRDTDDKELAAVGEQARLLLDDDRPQTEFLPSYAQPIPVVSAGSSAAVIWLDNNPFIFLCIAAVAVRILKVAGAVHVRLDGDVALLLIFACFCLGLHTPRPMVGGFDRPPTMMGAVRRTRALAHGEQDHSGRKLLRQAMKSAVAGGAAGDNKDAMMMEQAEEPVESDEEVYMGSPMAKFPDGAAIGSHNNCWSDPDPADFVVRGPNYIKDQKKISSGPFLFPCRGLDLFLTDTCPENVGRNPLIFGGRLREAPTFVINFRLPWGILLFYFEIPEKFVPFVKASYAPDNDKASLPSMDEMSPPERAACRFLMKDQAHKNHTLKIIPVVIDGPWVVRQVVGGKPAIIGNKLPVQYVYEPESEGKALYLEADLDIAASSAARGILSVTRSYTQVLTLNLGFVVQGNHADELPEQMLVGVRLHGIDPLTAPAYPPMHDDLLAPATGEGEDDD